MNISSCKYELYFYEFGQSARWQFNTVYYQCYFPIKLLDLKDSSGLADNSLRESDPNFSHLLWTLPSVLFPCLSEK